MKVQQLFFTKPAAQNKADASFHASHLLAKHKNKTFMDGELFKEAMSFKAEMTLKESDPRP